MPPAATPRQPGTAAPDWFEGHAGQALVQHAQRQSIPELTRVFGHTGLFLRPGPGTPAQLSGNMLARVISLYRSGRGYDGDLRCLGAEFPVATASLALVYGLFVVTDNDDGEALLAEIARMLKPEGVALVLSLNPLSPYRARWAFGGVGTLSDAAITGLLRRHGLEVSRQRKLGPLWKTAVDEASFGREASRLLSPFRAATLTVARRRDPALNPMRQSSPGIRLHTGVSTG